MLRVGLTGGIGSGKSTAAKIFEILGAPVYYADEAAKKILQEDEQLIRSIKKAFGTESYVNGMYNRPYISGIVFKDPKKLALLNSLVHPATIADAEKWMSRQTFPYSIKEAALIFESGSDRGLDKVIGVYAPQELRIARVLSRDAISADEVMARINRQMNEEEKMKRCDFVLQNDEKNLLIPQVVSLHTELMRLAGD